MIMPAFIPGAWQTAVDVRDFIQKNYTPYEGDASFLAGATERTNTLNAKYERLKRLEHELGGVVDIDTTTVSSLLNYPPGYLDKDKEIILGLQTNRPLKRGVNPFGGIRMAEQACQGYGYELSPQVLKHFQYRTTHNDGVFRVYSPEMRAARRCGIITGLPDSYGRGRIIGDYRRVALYGVDALIQQKEADKLALSRMNMDDENIRLSEEVYRHIDFLDKLKQMAAAYGIDISGPARDGREATQWVYFAYLAAIKEQNGAAMSLGRVSTFLDIYFERDLATGRLDEAGVQEIIDDFVLKLRMARQLRTPEYNELFAGDPMWITEAIGGMGEDGRTLVTKTSYRFLNTLRTLGPAPEPNLTVLWSNAMPENFKNFCAELSIETDSLQYENDDLMRTRYGDDYAIACCVSAAAIGKQMQFFGARCNLAKLLLLALNGGRDEISGVQVGPVETPVGDGVLDYDDVRARYRRYLEWLANLYVNTMNIIHYMHDKYAYEKIQMALHDTWVKRFMSFGAAGLSVTADSFSAIKHAQVTPIRDERGLVTDFSVEGDYPAYGNDDDRVDSIATALCDELIAELRKTPAYRQAEHTLSILTITSNIVYGKKTGSTPCGRKLGEPFAPGANPMHRRDCSGALASLNSVAKLNYDSCRDGISNTFSLVPESLGHSRTEQRDNLVSLLDGYFSQPAHHLNVNVLNREKLLDAMEHPEKYPNLTIRVSGYAVNFNSLSRKQQEEVLSRTYHDRL
ncbi:MAG: formate C-acetyltransferase [Lentisphaerae bacterium]|nr:formate C-acetyltransferase [Lentisphaerota bacterium]